MKKILIFAVLLLVPGVLVRAGVSDPTPAATQPVPIKSAKHSHKMPPSTTQACQCGAAGTAMPPANPQAAAGVNPALTGLARQAVNAALPGNPAVANALDQAVTSLASADTQALAPMIKSQPTGTSGPPVLHGWPMELSAGIQSLNGQIAPAVNLRIRLNDRISIRSPFSVEVGGSVLNSPSESFEAAAQTVDSTQYSAHIKSFWELHAAEVYAFPHGNQTWIVPEADLGVSMMHVENQVQALSTVMEQSNGQSYPNQTVQYTTQDRIGWSPLVRLGVTLFPENLFSLRFDAAYVGYANVVNAYGTTLDLGFSGVTYRMMLNVKL